jgi:anti-sigma regulatory factor (Ser/Thr protein kinase)
VEDDLVQHRPHGIQIMQALMQDVQMETDDRGTTVTLRRRRSA